jgi:small subunit ribosomal protein S7
MLVYQNMELILDALRTSPAPPSNSDLITPSPIQSLPLHPVAYLTAIIDSVAPLIKIRQQRGLLGGGASMPIPVPLRLRQRRRTAIQWILASAEGRREDKFADRVAKELLSVAEGRSSSWEKRARVHKMAISARANIKAASMGRRVRSKSIRGK